MSGIARIEKLISRWRSWRGSSRPSPRGCWARSSAWWSRKSTSWSSTCPGR